MQQKWHIRLRRPRPLVFLRRHAYCGAACQKNYTRQEKASPFRHINLILPVRPRILPVSNKFDVIILGSGAAGLFCAAEASARGLRVALLERNTGPGRKILISGGGRCNLTNLSVTAENSISANRHFAKSALTRYTPADFIALVDKHEIRWHEKTPGQLFCDGSAREILRMLEQDCSSGGVKTLMDTDVQSIEAGYRIVSSRGTFEAEKLVVATGGLSIPKMGATGFGYQIARQFGLDIVAPRPALAPFTFSPVGAKRWSDLLCRKTVATSQQHPQGYTCTTATSLDRRTNNRQEMSHVSTHQ